MDINNGNNIGPGEVIITGEKLTIHSVVTVSRNNRAVHLTSDIDVRNKIILSQNIVLNKAETKCSIYGINTGFGGKF